MQVSIAQKIDITIYTVMIDELIVQCLCKVAEGAKVMPGKIELAELQETAFM